MSTALIISAAPQPALVAALRDLECTDVDTMSLEAALAMLAHEKRVQLAVVDVAQVSDLDTVQKLASSLRGAALVVLAPDHLIDAAFDAGATDCIATPIRAGELIARLRGQLRSRTAARRSRRERRLTEELRVLQREKQDLERIACVDSLTGVANRRHALNLLDAEWKRSARDGTELSLVMVDLDCFHAFNEHYGHVGGDRCLRAVTDTMVRSLRRPSDFLGRYGGEEFFAVLASTDAQGAGIVAERMRAAVEALAIQHGASECSDVVTMSVGFATCRPTAAGNPEELVQAADRALLTAKATGRNRISGDAPAPPTAPLECPRPRLASTPWRRFPPVIADPWFADRIPPFLANTSDEIRRMREAIEARTFDRIRAQGRRLRLAAGDHSIETIAELAGMLERSARLGDADSLRRVLDELEAYVAHVQVTYRRPAERELEQAG